VTTLSDDALQRRIARLVGDVRAAKAMNCGSNVCLGTNLGSVRKENQDRALVVWADYPENPDRNFTLAVLSDGMGGLMNGEEAATITLSVFVSRILRTPRMPPPERLRNAALYSNNAVYDQFGGRGGATLSAVFIGNNGSKIGINIGDSRIYAVTGTRELVQLSRDDTLAGVLGEQHRSNENHNRLVQFMGMGEGMEPNIVDVDRKEIHTLLVTSDGVHGSPMAALNQIVRRARSETDLTRKLLSLSELLGGQDNGTAIALGTETRGHLGDGEQGLNLTFLSVNERLEVWIPILAEEARQERPRASQADKDEPVPPQKVGSIASNVGADDLKRQRRSRARGGRSNKGSATEEQGLPLDADKPSPVLDVKFPSSE
jgi:serine/threonine protein phosphatase PrpC